MSDATTAWRMLLAFGCAWGAMILKCSGVPSNGEREMAEAGGIRDGMGDELGNARGDLRGVHADPMTKGTDEHRGQIIDFLAARQRLGMRRWAMANGFAPVSVKK